MQTERFTLLLKHYLTNFQGSSLALVSFDRFSSSVSCNWADWSDGFARINPTTFQDIHNYFSSVKSVHCTVGTKLRKKWGPLKVWFSYLKIYIHTSKTFQHKKMFCRVTRCGALWRIKMYYICSPYHAESTGSRPITEVKQRRARLVLGLCDR